MESSFLSYVKHGKIGELALGLTRAQIIKKLGLPKTWVGKPPCFGQHIVKPEDAEAWGYYEAAGIRFGSQGTSISVSVIPSKIRSGDEPFLGWPIGPSAKMEAFLACLTKNEVPFDEGDDANPGSYYIIGDRRCVAIGIPYKGGKLIPRLEREISMIETFADDQHLPSFVIRYWRRRPS
jgi:hypothetical protein